MRFGGGEGAIGRRGKSDESRCSSPMPIDWPRCCRSGSVVANSVSAASRRTWRSRRESTRTLSCPSGRSMIRLTSSLVAKLDASLCQALRAHTSARVIPRCRSVRRHASARTGCHIIRWQSAPQRSRSLPNGRSNDIKCGRVRAGLPVGPAEGPIVARARCRVLRRRSPVSTRSSSIVHEEPSATIVRVQHRTRWRLGSNSGLIDA
jgi:hypothetical protein